MRRRSLLVLLIVVAGIACRASSSSSASGAVASDSEPPAATPVTMGAVTLRTIEVHVSGTGGLDALNDERVRAPFNGILMSLTVNVGDRVAVGQVIGSMIAENSEAALRGAQSMVSSARTAAERIAAREALRVAQANVVHTPLVVAKGGIVITRPASTGERLAQGDSVVSIATTSKMVFFANVAQTDLALVQSGQRARVHIASRPETFPGVVHNIMPADTASTATMRVRIDLNQTAAVVPVGAFGTAVIVVNERANVPAVPRAALRRDDVSGRSQIAIVEAGNIAHWVEVVPGIADSSWVEVRTPRLAPGQRVITMGQVGLPDSAHVVLAPKDSIGGRGKTQR